ncbi:hypothetical protein LASUN_01280 [Lentilactobacillus sunkii]|uniref:Uncharacterized protein n=1 Tax=Lentilactobacillus sunkii TaxID=481719 RepID=A0A1E7XJ84_9LACO|nr:hypothetical protein [Lentilactobacillus sunkii]OFA13129.1 hypothetical protein LASUN_01280 [Lentilactobacillus sunkii]
MNTKDKVKYVLASDLDSTFINEVTGIPISNINNARAEGFDPGTISLNDATELVNLYNVKFSGLAQAFYGENKDLSKFRHRLTNILQRLYSQELEKEKSDSESHETGAYVSSIEQLFDDVLNDEEEMKKLYRVFVQASKISYPQK